MTGWLGNHLMVCGSWGALLGIMLLPALEAALPMLGIAVPGQTAVVVGGMLARQGRVPLIAVLAAALAGAVIGNAAGFSAGRRWNSRLIDLAPRRLVRPANTRRALRLVERTGSRSVVVARFTPGLRTLVPTLCGMSGMRKGRYLVWSVVSGGVWASVFVLLGYACTPGGAM
jgi:membrane protein DedA with SNARE-associated domain